MDTLAAILVFTALGGVFSALIAGVFLLLSKERRDRLMPHSVSFATGTLLATALLALIPHAMAGAGLFRVHGVGVALLCGIALFFVLEKFLLWRHCHTEAVESAHTHEHHRREASGWLTMVGDGLHNLIDGVLIAAAFLTDFHLGVVTAFAIMAHEIPQEVGNFAVLLQGGFTRAKAFAWNLLSGLTAVLGGLVGWWALWDAMALLPYALAVAAASLLYVAVADLIPGLHRKTDLRASAFQVLGVGVGVGVVVLAESQLH
ncbi:MAG: ZIP family metal transporter [Gammaproteobacteria bacterium]|nr:ZIP family metal transporter [Gammaproteobacteria bacterium]